MGRKACGYENQWDSCPGAYPAWKKSRDITEEQRYVGIRCGDEYNREYGTVHHRLTVVDASTLAVDQASLSERDNTLPVR